MSLHVDFETRSIVDLKKTGVAVYAEHPTTDALCMAWAIDEGPVNIWKLGEALPPEITEAVASGMTVAAHNAQFEFYIWNYVCGPKYGWPPLPLQQMDCTMIRGYAMGLPGKLSSVAHATGMKMKKDMKGQRVMLQLAKPRSGPDKKCIYCNGTGVALNETCKCVVWWDTPEKYETLYSYCKQDIFVERELDKRVMTLSAKEKRLWFLDQKINNRGVFVDAPAIETALQIVDVEKARLNGEIQKATGNQVATCNASVAFKKWINTFDIYEGAVYSKDGPPSGLKGQEGQPKWRKGGKKICQSVDKASMLDMLEMKISKKVKKAISIRQEAAKSSVGKLQAMLRGRNKDGRVRGCLQFNGAASTQRWAGRRIQPQNMTRPTIDQEDIEEIVEVLRVGQPAEAAQWISIFHGPPMLRIADCLRAMIRAKPGNKLVSCDFSSIEGKVLAWLAGEERKLAIYRGHGRVYEHTACQIYGLTNIDDVTKEQRLVGKVAELACGYQGGVGAFQSMAKVYFVKVPDARANQIKSAWRKANPAVVKYWHNVERAAINAVKYDGEKISVGHPGRSVTFLKKGSFLFCRLPSGRAICYPYPKIRRVRTPWGEMKNALTYKGEEKFQFVTKVGYGGLLVENITQATARDLLGEALPRVEAKGYSTVLHIHDEIVSEVKKDFGSVEEMNAIMSEVPVWAKDLPISAEGWEGERFRK